MEGRIICVIILIMSNEQVKNKLDDVQLRVRDTLQTLRKILERTKELDELEEQLMSLNSQDNVKQIDFLRRIKAGFMDDIDLHIDSLSKLINEYQEVVSDTI